MRITQATYGCGQHRCHKVSPLTDLPPAQVKKARIRQLDCTVVVINTAQENQINESLKHHE